MLEDLTRSLVCQVI